MIIINMNKCKRNALFQACDNKKYWLEDYIVIKVTILEQLLTVGTYCQSGSHDCKGEDEKLHKLVAVIVQVNQKLRIWHRELRKLDLVMCVDYSLN